MTSNDPAVATELLEQFAGEADQLLDQLRKELEEGRGDAAAETAQTIRGTAATLGYQEIIELAAIIEEYAPSDSDHCRVTAEKIPGAISRVRESVAKLHW